MKGYDNIAVNQGIVLDLPFREASGLITHDIAKPHHIATLTGPPVWTDVHAEGIGPSDLGILEISGAEYLQVPGANSLDLDFTGDFSLAMWVYIKAAGAMTQMLMCRNGTDVSGWAMYFTPDAPAGHYLSLRTNQAGGHTDCYIAGIPDVTLMLLGFSRDSAGLSAIGFKNGQPQTTTLTPGGILDPVASGAARKLLVGVQDGEAMNFANAYLWRPRAWPWKLSAEDWEGLFEQGKHWFGV